MIDVLLFPLLPCTKMFPSQKTYLKKSKVKTQECIPVGCIQPTPVIPPPLHRDPLPSSQRPDSPSALWTETRWTEIPLKKHGTRQPDRMCHHTETPSSPVNRQKDVKALPCSKTSFAGGNNNRQPRQQ